MRKIRCVLVSSILAVSMLTACGKNKTTADNSSANIDSGSNVAVNASVTTETAPSSGENAEILATLDAIIAEDGFYSFDAKTMEMCINNPDDGLDQPVLLDMNKIDVAFDEEQDWLRTGGWNEEFEENCDVVQLGDRVDADGDGMPVGKLTNIRCQRIGYFLDGEFEKTVLDAGFSVEDLENILTANYEVLESIGFEYHDDLIINVDGASSGYIWNGNGYTIVVLYASPYKVGNVEDGAYIYINNDPEHLSSDGGHSIRPSVDGRWVLTPKVGGAWAENLRVDTLHF